MKIANNIPTNHIKELKKIEWKSISPNDSRKFFEDVTIKNEVLGNISISIREFHDGCNRLIIEIKNFLDKVLGKEILSIDKKDKKMLGYNIDVLPEYRRKKFRFGELIRLFSVMEMVENKTPHLEIYSKDTAVFFHSKYKFVPAEKTFDGRNKILHTIANDNTEGFETLKSKACELLKKISYDKKDAKKQRQYCKDTNILAKEYIEKALQDVEPEKKHPFCNGLTMRLYLEDVKKNKDFFNERLKNQGIDYSI